MTPLRSATALLLPLSLLAACGDDVDGTSATSGSSTSTHGGSSGDADGDTASPPTTTSSADSTSANPGSTSIDATDSSNDGTDGTDGTDDADDTDDTGAETGQTSGGLSEVDLADYQAATDVVPIPAPNDDASGIAWNHDTDRVWVVENGAGRFHEYPADDLSASIRTISLVGINGNDTEGLTYLGGGEVAVAFEGGYGVYIADVPDGDANVSVPVKQTLTLAPPPPVGNNGLEGIAYDPGADVFYAVGEGQDNAAPRRFFRFARPLVQDEDFDWQDPELTVEEPFDADDALPESGASLDLAGIVFDPRDGNVLIISHTGSRVLQLDPAGDGTVLGELQLTPNQWEGIALVGAQGDLVMIAESNEMQRFSLVD